MPEIREGHIGLPHTQELDGRSLLVWPGQSSLLCLQHDRCHGPLPRATQKFEWTASHDAAFRESKRVIAQEIQHGVEIFLTRTSPPASPQTGPRMGWATGALQLPIRRHLLLQNQLEDHTGGIEVYTLSRITICPHRGRGALDKACHFVLGCSLLQWTTNPYSRYKGDRSIDQIGNTRLRNLKEKTLRYRFRMIHIPGVRNKTPDALSRYPTGTTTPDCMVLPDGAHTITSLLPQPRPSIPSTLMSGIPSDDCDTDWLEHIIQNFLVQALSSTHPLPHLGAGADGHSC